MIYSECTQGEKNKTKDQQERIKSDLSAVSCDLYLLFMINILKVFNTLDNHVQITYV